MIGKQDIAFGTFDKVVRLECTYKCAEHEKPVSPSTPLVIMFWSEKKIIKIFTQISSSYNMMVTFRTHTSCIFRASFSLISIL